MSRKSNETVKISDFYRTKLRVEIHLRKDDHARWLSHNIHNRTKCRHYVICFSDMSRGTFSPVHFRYVALCLTCLTLIPDILKLSKITERNGKSDQQWFPDKNYSVLREHSSKMTVYRP